ncbi:MAG: hypothetical protein DRN15_10245 [Thermoprotei archaeon]|nr:MAG: hypothetical protein DRN15_10245 [Thermoprotei archaeon]RLF24156.1 MAG: hypothetical protein DRM97_03825 [Thermoprotei archaeon]
MRKKPYPRNSDIKQAIMKVISWNPLLHPSELVSAVKEELEREGFYPGLVTEKRIWRLYEELVKKKVMYDVLGVVGQEVDD